MPEETVHHKKSTRKRSSKDNVSKLKNIVNIFTSKRGMIFFGILVVLSILEMVFKVESSVMNIIKIIIQFLFLAPA